MPTDLSQYSDDELEKIASGGQSAAAPAPATDLSHYSDAELENFANQGKLLSNAPSGETPTEQAIPKAIATAGIKGLTSIPGAMGPGISDMVDYLMARGHNAITGEPVEDILKRYNKIHENLKDQGPMGKFLYTIDPRNVMPRGEDLAKPIFEKTGEYKPESTLGQVGMAGTEMVAGGWGPAMGAKVGTFAKPGFYNALTETLKDAVKMAPANFAAGSTGEALTQATGDPLAGLVGGMVIPHYGGKLVDAAAAPVKKFTEPMFKENQQGMADSLLYQIFTDPKAAYEKLKENHKDILTGSPKTTGEATLDPGALLAQKNAENVNTDFKVRMDAVRNEQNRARVEALRSMSPDNADLMMPSKALSEQSSMIDKAHDQVVNALTENAEDLHNKMPSGTAPEATGAAIRKMTDEAMVAAREARSDLYKLVDPDKKLSVVTTGSQEVGKNLQSTIDPNVSLSSPHAAPVIDMVAKLGDVTPYHKLVELDKTITSQMAQAKRAGDYTGHEQLRSMKTAVMSDIHNAVDNQHAWEQAAVRQGKLDPEDTIAARLRAYGAEPAGNTGAASGEGAVRTGTSGEAGVSQEGVGQRFAGEGLPGTPTSKGLPTGKPEGGTYQQDLNNYTIFHPGGQLQARYEVVDLPSLVTSHDRDLRVNPQFPQELQPRDRTMAGSKQQIDSIAKNLKPEMLGPAREANSGAPIVGPDNIVESGNGRTLALSKAYEGPQGQAYKQWLESQGFNTQGMQQPVLIARRTSEMTPQERQRFTSDTSSQSGLAMTASEKAGKDSSIAASIEAPVTFGDVGKAENSDFVRKFVEALPPSERGMMMDKSGMLSPEGQRRIEAALVSRAYGDSAIVEKAFMNRDNDIKSITNAMTDAAGPWHEMRKAAADGRIPADADVTKQLTEAISAVSKAIADDMPRGAYLNQSDFARSPISDAVRKLISPDGVKIGSSKYIGEALNNYAQEALKNVKEGRMFGDALSAEDVLKASVDKTMRENGVTPAAPQAEQPKTTEGSVFDRPYFEQGAADRLSQAKTAHSDFARTFRQEPVKGALADYGYSGDYKMPAGAVPDRVFPTGPKGYENTNAFLKANNNSPEIIAAIKQTAINKLRDTMGGDALLTQRKLDAWKTKYDSSLRAIEEAAPGFKTGFDNLASATESLNSARQANVERIAMEKKSAANQIIGAQTAEEMRSRVGSLLTATDGAAKIKEIMGRMAGNQDAIDGLRRAATEHLVDRFSNASIAGGEHTLSGAKFGKFLTANADSLEAMFGKEGVANMKRIGADLDRSQQAMDAVRARTGSDTAQNLFGQYSKIIEAKGHGSLATVFLIGGMEAFDKMGIMGALGVGATAALKSAADRLRANGVSNINDLLLRGLEDPTVGAAMLQRAIDKNGKPDLTAINRLNATLSRSNQLMQQEEERRRGHASGGRVSRATGGKVSNHEETADRLVRAAERAKNINNKDTEPLLGVHDDAIAKALDVAQAAI